MKTLSSVVSLWQKCPAAGTISAFFSQGPVNTDIVASPG